MRRISLSIAIAVSCICSGLLALTVFVTAAGDLSPKEARRLIARLAGIELPSDAVRVKEVSALGNSAVVVAQVETAFRFVKSDDKWRVAEIRTGNNQWEDVELLVRSLNSERTARARAELESVSIALESFKRERGFYVEATSEAILIDYLSPRYLTTVIRTDPWHHPYEYEGTRTGYILRSNGPDEKPGTSDDVVVSK